VLVNINPAYRRLSEIRARPRGLQGTDSGAAVQSSDYLANPGEVVPE